MDSETVLFVLGDHGMTQSGDHGGDSGDEVSAGLFVYSPAELHREEMVSCVDFCLIDISAPHMLTFQNIRDSVNQIDLVPTMALLLDVPIPFSNLGKVMIELFPDRMMRSRAVELNVLQVSHTFETMRVLVISGSFPGLPVQRHVHDQLPRSAAHGSTTTPVQDLLRSRAWRADDGEVSRIRPAHIAYFRRMLGQVPYRLDGIGSGYPIRNILLASILFDRQDEQRQGSSAIFESDFVRLVILGRGDQTRNGTAAGWNLLRPSYYLPCQHHRHLIVAVGEWPRRRRQSNNIGARWAPIGRTWLVSVFEQLRGLRERHVALFRSRSLRDSVLEYGEANEGHCQDSGDGKEEEATIDIVKIYSTRGFEIRMDGYWLRRSGPDLASANDAIQSMSRRTSALRLVSLHVTIRQPIGREFEDGAYCRIDRLLDSTLLATEAIPGLQRTSDWRYHLRRRCRFRTYADDASDGRLLGSTMDSGTERRHYVGQCLSDPAVSVLRHRSVDSSDLSDRSRPNYGAADPNGPGAGQRQATTAHGFGRWRRRPIGIGNCTPGLRTFEEQLAALFDSGDRTEWTGCGQRSKTMGCFRASVGIFGAISRPMDDMVALVRTNRGRWIHVSFHGIHADSCRLDGTQCWKW